MKVKRFLGLKIILTLVVVTGASASVVVTIPFVRNQIRQRALWRERKGAEQLSENSGDTLLKAPDKTGGELHSVTSIEESRSFPEATQPEESYGPLFETDSYRAQYAFLDLSVGTFDELMRAVEIYHAGDYETSFAMLQELFDNAPADEKPHLGVLLFERYFKYVELKRAEQIAETLKTDFPESPFTYLVQSRLAMFKGKNEESFAAVEKAFELAENDPRIFYWFHLLSEFRGSADQREKIEDSMSRYRRLYPDDAALCWSQLFYYHMQRRPNDAMATFADFKKLCPDKDLLVNTLGSICWDYAQLRQRDKAREVLLEATKIAPDDPWPHITLARLFHKDYEQCLQHYQDALELAGGPEVRSKIYREITNVHRSYRNSEEMLRASEQAVEAHPENPRNLLELARSYSLLGDHELAMKNCQKALSFAGTENMSPWVLSTVHEFLARLYQQEKDFDSYLQHQEKVTEVRLRHRFDQYADGYRSLLGEYNSRVSPEAAIEKAKTLIAENAGNPAVCASVADFYRDVGMYEQATELCTKAIQLSESENIKLRGIYNLGRVYLDKNQKDKGVELVKKATVDFPYNCNSYYYLGRVYEENGQLEKALAEYETARQLAWHRQDRRTITRQWWQLKRKMSNN